MANSNMKKTGVAGDVLKRTASLVGGAVADYFKGAMPTTSSTISEAKSLTSKMQSSMASKTKDVVSTVRKLNLQGGLKKIYSWYMDESDQYDLDFNIDDTLTFDIDLDDPASELEIAGISETAASANQISGAVVESSQHMLEGQVHISANIINKITEHAAITATGFDAVNAKLSDLLEVISKNSAVLIETTIGASDRFDGNKESAADSMILNGFAPSKFKQLVSENIESDPTMGMAKAFLPMLLDPNMRGMLFKPDEVAKLIVPKIADAIVPNLTEGLKTLDDTINETIMTGLISLGANKSWGFGATGLTDLAARIFGIDASRRSVSTSRSSLDVKATAFDTLTRESIVNVIPNYLGKILESISGKKEVYDYRSRTFKTKEDIEKEFRDSVTTSSSIYGATKNVSNAIGTDEFGKTVYDLMMTDLGSKFTGGKSKEIVNSFADPSKFVEYVSKELFEKNGATLSDRELARVEQMAQNVAAKDTEAIGKDIFLQSAKENVRRGARGKQYVANANKYETDLSGITTTAEDEMKYILSRSGKTTTPEAAIAGETSKPTTLSGVNYTNRALYEIFRVLNRGLNVFQVGSANLTDRPFDKWGDEYLPAPYLHRPRNARTNNLNQDNNSQGLNIPTNEEEDNLLRNNELEDGETEELTTGQRVIRWTKARGSGMMKAIMSGDPQAIRDEFGIIIRDITQVTGDAVKEGAVRINDQFGNVTGYLKHKFFGTGYSYQDGVDENGNPKIVHVADNEKGGVFGFVKDKMKDMFNGTKERATNWFQSVKGYFDYGDTSSGESSEVSNKRRKLIAASVGAMVGGGILGGPIGLIMGAVAGNAIGGVNDIGSKIKDFFFGHDKETGKGTGLLTRVGDELLLPIRYQFGKTVEHIASNVKKNIMGPLADIGQAIKDRITTAADNTFGKVFRFIGRLVLAPFKSLGKGLLNLAKLPTTIISGITRTVSSLGTNIIGGALTTVAHTIADGQKHTYIDENGEEQTMSSRKNLYNRAKERRKEAKEEKANSKYKSFKSYRDSIYAKRLEDDQKLAEYTSERQLTPGEYQALTEEREARAREEEARNEQRDHNEQMITTTTTIRDDVNRMAEEALTMGSLYTHDQGIHDYLKNIIAILKGEPVPQTPTTGEEPSAEISNETTEERAARERDERIVDSNDSVVEGLNKLAEALTENTSAVSDNTSVTENESVPEPSKPASPTSEPSKPPKRTLGDNIKAGIKKIGGKLKSGVEYIGNGILSTGSNIASAIVNDPLAKRFQPSARAKLEEKQQEEQKQQETFKHMDQNAAHIASENYASTALGAAATLASVNGVDDSNDQRIFGQIESEARKDDSNKAVIGAKTRELFNNQKTKKEKEEESLFEKILKWITNNPAIASFVASAAAIALGIKGILDWLNNHFPDNPLPDVANTIANNITTAGKNAWDKIFGKDNDGIGNDADAVTNGMNAATGVVDMQVENKWDWLNPFAKLTHINTDAAGNAITNQAATTAKRDAQLFAPLRQLATKDFKLRAEKFSLRQDVAGHIDDYNTLKAAKDQAETTVAGLDNQLNTARTRSSEMNHGANRYTESANNKYAEAENRLQGVDDANTRISKIEQEIADMPDTSPEYGAKIQERDALRTQAERLNSEADDLINGAMNDEALAKRFETQHTKQQTLADELEYQQGKAVKNQGIADEAFESFDNEYNVSGNTQRIAEIDDELVGNAKDTFTGIGKNLGRTAANVGVISVASVGAGAGAEFVAKQLGADDKTANRANRVATAATAGGLTLDVMRTAATGKSGVVSTIIKGLETMLKTIGKACKNNKVLGKFATKIDDMITKLFKGISDKIDDVIIPRLDAGLKKMGIKSGVNVISGGLGYVIGGIIGLVDGLCGVEYMFQVLPGEADGTMSLIAGVIRGVMGVIAMDPGIGWTVVLIETLDAVAQGLFDAGIIQFIAQGLYKLIRGDDALNGKQDQLKMELADYKEKYGGDLDTNDFNDLVNNSGLIDTLVRGKMERNEDGSLKFDKAGGRINTGIGSTFVGGEKDYMTDEAGNVIRDAEGNAVLKKDKYGNTIKVNERIGDQFIAEASNTKSFFTGRDVYQTDAHGNALVDENGQYVVDHHQYGLFEDPKMAVQQMFDDLGKTFSDLDVKLVKTVDSTKTELGKVPQIIADGKVGDLLALKADGGEYNPFDGLANSVLGVVKGVAFIPTTVVSGARGLVDSVSTFVNDMKEDGPLLLQTIATIPSYISKGDTAGLATVGNDIQFKSLMTGYISKMLLNGVVSAAMIPTSIVGAGKGISSGASKLASTIGSGLSSFGTMINEEVTSGTTALSKEDSSLSDYFKIEDNPDNPMSGFEKAIRIGIRVVSLPTVLVSLAANKIGQGITTLIGKVKDAGKFVEEEYKTSQAILKDEDSTKSDYFNIPDEPENPLNGITKAIRFGIRLATIPISITQGIGSKISKFVTGKVKDVKSSVMTLATNASILKSKADSGDVSGLWQTEMQTNPDNPVGGITNVLFTIEKVMFTPHAAMSMVGNKIKKVFAKVKSAVSTGFANLMSNHSSISSYVQSGDPSGLLGLSYQDNPENPLSGITNAIFTVDKIIHVPTAAFRWVGNKIKAGFNTVKDAASRSFTNLVTNHDSISQYVQSGDPSGLLGLTYQSNPEDPLDGFVHGLFTVDKMLSVPTASIRSIGNKIKEAFISTVSTVSSAKDTLDTNIGELDTAARSGSFENLGAVVYQGNEENPLNGLMSGIFSVSKLIHYPTAAIYFAGGKIKESFNKVVAAIGTTKADISTNSTAIDTYATAGNLEGLSGLSFEANPENPIGGMAVGVSNMIKLFNYPKALIKWTGNKIKNGLSSIGDTIKTDKENFDTALATLDTKYETGEVSQVWGVQYTSSASNPIGGIFNAAFTIAKIIKSAITLAVSGFKKAGKFVDDVKNKIGNFATDFGDNWKTGIDTMGDWAYSGIQSLVKGGPKHSPSVPAMNVGGPTIVGGNPLDKAATITSTYGKRELPYKGDHKGIDITPSNGDTNATVNSRHSGIVSYVERNVSNSDTARRGKDGRYQYSGSNSGGNQVWVDTDDGLRVKAMHLKGGSVPGSIKVGTRIGAGTTIGEMGSTGWSTGPHLHYQIEKMTNNKSFIPVNPTTPMGGPNKTLSKIVINANRSGDDANYSTWISIIKSIKAQIAAAHKGYVYGGNSMKLTANGYSRNYRTDCSGFVSHCLSCFAKQNIDVTSNTLLSANDKLTKAGFVKRPFPGWDKLIPGDIISKSGHVEIYAGKKDGQDKVWNCGSDSSCNNAGVDNRSYASYSVVWRLSSAPGSSIDVIGNDNGATISTPDGTSTSPASDTFIGKLTGMANEFMSVITGGLVGSTNTANTTTTTTTDTNVTDTWSSGDVDYGDSDTPKTVYSFFRGKGFSPQAASGVLGNMYQESGVDPKKIQGNGKGPAAGIAQWENYNTKSGRWKSMADYNKSRGKDWTDLQGQLEFIDKELSASSMNPFWNNTKSVEGRSTGPSSYEKFKQLSDVTEATYQFEKTFERAGKPNMPRRLKAAKEYYDKYKNLSGGTGGPTEDIDIPDMNPVVDERIGAPSIAEGIQKVTEVGSKFFSIITNGMTGNTSSAQSMDLSDTTATDSISATPVSSGTGNFPKYMLNNQQLRGIANIISHEQPGESGWKAEASLMANLTDKGGNDKATVSNLIAKATGGWFAHGKDRFNNPPSNVPEGAIKAAREVLVEGKRTLPRYIDEHDCFSDLTSVTNGGQAISKTDRSKYKPNVTKVKNRYGSSWTFYTFPNANADPFGYTSEELRQKWGDNHYGGSIKDKFVPAMNIPDRIGGDIMSKPVDQNIVDLSDAKKTVDVVRRHELPKIKYQEGPSIYNNDTNSASSMISNVDTFRTRSQVEFDDDRTENDVRATESRINFKSQFTDSDTNTTPVVNVEVNDIKTRMDKILRYLEAIVSNTGLSSDLLGSINDKDFVDQGLRDSLNALSKVKKPSGTYRYGSSGTSSASIANLARP